MQMCECLESAIQIFVIRWNGNGILPRHTYLVPGMMWFEWHCMNYNVIVCECCTVHVLQVSPEVLRPHIPDLVKVLLQCFRDDSWLVRDGGWLSNKFRVSPRIKN